MSDLQNLDRAFVANTYARFPLTIVSGKGSEVFSDDGKRYIDMGSGIGVTAFGICDDVWVSAVEAQLSRVQHMSNLYYTEPCAQLAKRLCERTGMKKVFFSNSGAEANECAIKAARKYAFDRKGKEYDTIVTLENSFHGRTITTLAATGQEHYHELFQPLTPGFVHTPANDIEAMRKTLSEYRVCAVMMECVQGEGGVIALDPDFVKEVYRLCRENDILLIIDEVQTGNGRTGKLYAYQHFDILPDLVSTAKGLGGGLPIGACLFGEKVEDVLGFGDHGSTFGGNPIACAGAISILDRMDDAFLSEVTEKAEMIRTELNGAKGIRSVSGLGLMVGIETVGDAKTIVSKCMEKGILCLTAKNKVRLLPALNIPKDLLSEAIRVIKAICAEEESK